MNDPLEYLQDNEVIPGGAQELPGSDAYLPPLGVRAQELKIPQVNLPLGEKILGWLRLPFARTIFNADYGQARFITNDITQQLIFQAEIKRQYLLVQNKSTDSIFIGFGQKASADSSLEIGAGSTYEPAVPPINSIYIIGNQGGGQQVVIAIQGLV